MGYSDKIAMGRLEDTFGEEFFFGISITVTFLCREKMDF